MNKEYNDNKEYSGALSGLRFSEEAKARMVQNLLDAQEQPVRRRVRRSFPRIAAVGVAAALVLCVGAGATGALKTAGEAFAGLFGAGAAGTEIIDKIGRPVGASATDNGVTITADAIIGDKYHYAITYTIEKDDGTPFDVDLSAIEGTNCLPLRFEDWDTTLSFFRDGQHGSSYFYDADPGDNAIQYIEMMETSKECKTGGTARVEFGNLYYSNGGEEKLLAEGRWELRFAFEFEDTSVSLPAGQTFELNGMDFAIDQITLSPIALRVDYTVDSEVQWSDAPSGRQSDEDSAQMKKYFESVQITVNKKDGTSIDMSNAGGSIKPDNGKTVCQKGNMFEEVVPLEDIVSITVAGIDIPVQ